MRFFRPNEWLEQTFGRSPGPKNLRIPDDETRAEGAHCGQFEELMVSRFDGDFLFRRNDCHSPKVIPQEYTLATLVDEAAFSSEKQGC